jgi:FtsP/CotA-like multicopper oxidase with cupredoxin domain
MSNSSTPADDAATLLERSGSRREFLRNSAVTVIAGGVLAACKGKVPDTEAAASPQTPLPAKLGADSNLSGGTMPPPAQTALAAQQAAADQMDAMHEAGIKAFPAKTAGKGNQLLAPVMDGKTKVFNLTARPIKWENAPGMITNAWAYNDQVPGPMIRVKEGDRVRVVLKNELPESTSIHFHGLIVPNEQDGVPFITQKPVKPGATYTYEFTVSNSGSNMYHSHHNSTKQVGMGLLGAFIVEPKNPRAIERADIDHVMILNDSQGGYTLNGKGFPATEPIVAKRGQKVRIRFMNEGIMIHPMHLHGMPMTVISKDGWPQPAPWKCDTLNIAPGERWDVIVNCTELGTWAFHCHILPHAESEHGMFGMVTALIVQA